MSASELFASQWQALQLQRQKLVQEAGQLKRSLYSLSSEPDMQQLLEEKDQLKKIIPELKNSISLCQGFIDGHRNKLAYRRKALTDKRAKRKLDTLIKENCEKIANLEEGQFSNSALEDVKLEMRLLQAPLEEAEEICSKFIARERQLQEVAQQMLGHALDRVATIEEHYRDTKKCLKEAIVAAQQQLQNHHLEEISWAARDRQRLEWMLENQPTFKHEVIRRYRARFPQDDISDLILPPPVSAPNPKKAKKKKRHAKPANQESESTSASLSQSPPTWKFHLTFSENDPGRELPQAKNDFLRVLQSALNNNNYHGIKVKLVYKKLMLVCGMSIQERQTMKEIKKIELAGWKILKVTTRDRLFLSINEEQRIIRFLPCKRKESYNQH